MTIPARVPSGVPTGGRFATATKSEPNLTLVTGRTGERPSMPNRVALTAEWPNRFQRLDRLNEAYYAVAAHASTPGQERMAAARNAVRDTFETAGRFVSLPEDDGQAAAHVFDGILSDSTIDQALDRVGALEPHEARSFGNRLAGALHDIETEARERRDVAQALAPTTESGAAVEDAWPAWLPTEPPALDETW